MVQPQAVVVVDLVSEFLVGAMRDDPEVQEARQFLDQFQLEGALSDIGGLQHTAQVLSRLDMLEHHL